MNRRRLIKSLLGALGFLAVGGLAGPAEARRGRPASPNSVAGVRRRRRRRHRRRRRRRIHRGMRLSTLPYGCSVTRTRGGVTYYWCGGIWYRPVYHGTTIVYIVEDIDSGASTDVEFEEEVYE